MGNEDYAREQAEKELRKKRADGVAPWGFDDVKAPKQWYEQASSSSSATAPATAAAPPGRPSSAPAAVTGRGGNYISEEKAQRMQRRAERERKLADPVTAFMGSAETSRGPSSSSAIPTGRVSRFSPAYVPQQPPPQQWHGGKSNDDRALSPSSSLSSSPSLSSDDDDKHSRRRRSHERSKKKEKRCKKEKKAKKKKKEEKKEKDRKHKRSRASGSLSPPAGARQQEARPSSAPSSYSSSNLEVLRQRRLEREREEHRKAVHLLAARQRAGLSYPTDASPMLDQPENVEMDERKRDYNSRFFPSR